MNLTFFKRIIRLIFGLFLFALGVVMQIQAQVGYAPWDVFHAGLSKTFGLSIGQVTILAGIVIVLIIWLLKEPIGIGTLGNMLLIGTFVDLIMSAHLIPRMTNPVLGIGLLIAGLFVISLASYFYIGSGFGAGPRDALMVTLHRHAGLSIGWSRSLVEFVATVAGWFLGGMVGIGTILAVGGIGIVMQLMFRLLKFDPKDIVHETFTDYFRPKT